MSGFHRSYIENRVSSEADDPASSSGGDSPSVGIIGGGIAGLTTAHHLARHDVSVRVFEQSDEPGGCLDSDRTDGYLLERGPHTLMAGNHAFERLLEDVGLNDARQPAPEAASRRYIVKRGRLLPLPTSLREFIQTPLFSRQAKLGLLAEPFRSSGPGELDESLGQLVKRRLGEDFLDYAVGPFVAGIYAADPRLLSSTHALGALREFDQQWGSIAVGGIVSLISRLLRGGPSPSGELFGLEGGNQRLAEALADRLGDRLELNAPIRRLRRTDAGWIIATDDGQRAGPFDDLVVTAPTHTWPDFEFDDDQLATSMHEIADNIDYPPVAVVDLAYDRSEIHHALDGFGMLVPGTESYRMLGTLFMSTLFPDRAPDGKVLLSTFVGGSRDRSLGQLDDETLVSVVDSDLSELIGIRENPDFADVFRWPQAIPQYEVGFDRILDDMDGIERNYRGLHLVGNFRHGVGVPDVIESATELGRDLARLHTTRTPTALSTI
jgi:oxygen-dependent protoporphyrinogen oxidase